MEDERSAVNIVSYRLEPQHGWPLSLSGCSQPLSLCLSHPLCNIDLGVFRAASLTQHPLLGVVVARSDWLHRTQWSRACQPFGFLKGIPFPSTAPLLATFTHFASHLSSSCESNYFVCMFFLNFPFGRQDASSQTEGVSEADDGRKKLSFDSRHSQLVIEWSRIELRSGHTAVSRKTTRSLTDELSNDMYL